MRPLLLPKKCPAAGLTVVLPRSAAGDILYFTSNYCRRQHPGRSAL